MEVEKESSGHTESTKCSFAGALTFILGLIGGTFSAVCCKMSFESEAIGLDGEMKSFEKPIAIVFLMFAAMCPAFFIWLIQQAFKKPSEREVITWKMFLLLVVPCVCDLLCTLLLVVAQLFITASMWQMMRGTVIIITAILKRAVLNHKLRRHMWAGVCVIGLAMVIVASSSFIGSSNSTSSEHKNGAIIGILLVLLGCLAQGVQYIFEEKVMAVDDVPPLVVIGFEGAWGVILCILVVYPAAYMIPGSDVGGCYENPWDSLEMLRTSVTLRTLILSFMATVTVYNCMAVYVTRYLSAIWHAILDNFRPITIWGLDLAIFYVILPGQGYGESWTPGSYVQLLGVLVLFLGTGIYNGNIPVCNDEYVPIDTISPTADNSYKPVRMTDISMASPSITRSPMVVGRPSDKLRNEKAVPVVKKRYSEA